MVQRGLLLVNSKILQVRNQILYLTFFDATSVYDQTAIVLPVGNKRMQLVNAIVLLSVFISSLSSPVIASESIWHRETESYSGILNITVYRSPSCSCCGGWMEHLERHGFQVKDIKAIDMEAIKQKYNLPKDLTSCHTALIDGYVIEGHVPADDIKRLLKEKPQLTGLSVPQMPVGTPGMEVGNKKEPFAVISFKKNGEFKVFKEYQSY